MDGFPLAARANRAFALHDYSTAISLYNEALEEDEDNCMLLWWVLVFVRILASCLDFRAFSVIEVLHTI
jgi:hypothetical protein